MNPMSLGRRFGASVGKGLIGGGFIFAAFFHFALVPVLIGLIAALLGVVLTLIARGTIGGDGSSGSSGPVGQSHGQSHGQQRRGAAASEGATNETTASNPWDETSGERGQVAAAASGSSGDSYRASFGSSDSSSSSSSSSSDSGGSSSSSSSD